MKINLKTFKEQKSIVEIREFIQTNAKKLTNTDLKNLYEIISYLKDKNDKFLKNFLNSELFRLAYKAETKKSREIQDLPLGEFINKPDLTDKYFSNIVDNMVKIREYLGRQQNSSKIAKKRWAKKT